MSSSPNINPQTYGFVVERNIPMPAPARVRVEIPFGVMQVGDSFLVAPAEIKRIGSAVYHYGMKTGRRFSRRQMKDGNYRIWRIR